MLAQKRTQIPPIDKEYLPLAPGTKGEAENLLIIASYRWRLGYSLDVPRVCALMVDTSRAMASDWLDWLVMLSPDAWRVEEVPICDGGLGIARPWRIIPRRGQHE